VLVCMNYWDGEFVGHFVIEIVGEDVCALFCGLWDVVFTV